jgi:tryptophan synthase beta subunit
MDVGDIQRQTLDFHRMRPLRAPAFQPVSFGSHTFKDTNEASRGWAGK